MGFKMFKPAVLAAFIGTALLSSVSVQAASQMISMQEAIQIAQDHTGKYAHNAELQGKKKNAHWEIDLTGLNGQETELRVNRKTGKISREYEDYEDDRDDVRENKAWARKVESGAFKTLEEAVDIAEERWENSHATEASFDNGKDNDDDYDDDDDDYENKAQMKPHYEVELKNGRREREVTVKAKK